MKRRPPRPKHSRSLSSSRRPATKSGRRRPVKRSHHPALRWNPDPEDVRRSVVKLVLTLVELIRKLMERQAIRRMEERTLTADETEAIGRALMELERTIRDIGRTFELAQEDLNIDLGPIKLL